MLGIYFAQFGGNQQPQFGLDPVVIPNFFAGVAVDMLASIISTRLGALMTAVLCFMIGVSIFTYVRRLLVSMGFLGYSDFWERSYSVLYDNVDGYNERDRKRREDRSVSDLADAEEVRRRAAAIEMELRYEAFEAEYRSREIENRAGREDGFEPYFEYDGLEHDELESLFSEAEDEVYQDVSGYWMPGSPLKFYIDSEGKPMEYDNRTGKVRDRSSVDVDEQDDLGF